MPEKRHGHHRRNQRQWQTHHHEHRMHDSHPPPRPNTASVIGIIRRVVTTMTALPQDSRPHKLGILIRQPPLVAHRAESLKWFGLQVLAGPDETTAVSGEDHAAFT